MAKLRLYKLILFLLFSCCCVYTSFAQARAKKEKKPAKKEKHTDKVKTGKDTAHADSTAPAKFRPVDTVIIIDPKTGKPVSTPKGITVKPLRKPDTIIYIDNGKPRQTRLPENTPRKVDTVIVIRNGKQQKELQQPRRDSVKPTIIQVPPSCNCVAMKLKAPDTLRYNDYVNYSFIFKNNCKEIVWIHSASFGFNVMLPEGLPVRILHKLQFMKQYKYPDFVPLSPGEEFSFDFGDDPFFQYELHTNWRYKFNFTYYNTSSKYKGAPAKTYLCTELRNKIIFITDKPKAKSK